MNASKRQKLIDLEAMRRRLPHISQVGLSSTLQDIKKHGLPDLDRRVDINAARELPLNERTPYGPISVEREVPTTEGGTFRFRMASPVALLYFVFFHCAEFATFFEQRLRVCPSTEANPWNLLLYCDEVHPGDQLGGKKLRKFHAIYFSFKEFGPTALSHEDMWFTIATVRTQVVNQIPGAMSKVFSLVLRDLFLDGPLADIGMDLEHAGRRHKFFSKMGFFIQDGAAHKQTWHCKGDAGCKLCVLCRNIFSMASEVVGDGGEGLLRCNAKTYAELDLASSADLRYAVRHLNDLRNDPRVTPDDFEVKEKALGFTWSPYNLLGDPEMDPYLDVPDQFFHDWMHMIFVGGIFNLSLHFFLEAVKDETRSNVYASLRGYVARYNWPKRWNTEGQKLALLFTDAKRTSNVKAKSFKCSASDGLSLYLLIAHWAAAVLPAETCPAERLAFIALCDVIDCLRATAYIEVAGRTVLAAVEAFLDLYDTAYGMEWSTPKFHWLLHFGDYVEKFRELVSCWPLERKHKVPKSYGADVSNTRIYETSVLHEVICKHIAALRNPDTFSFLRSGLFKPQRAAKKLLDWLSKEFEVPAHIISCFQAKSARHSEQVVVSVGDCILYTDEDGTVGAGEVWSNFELEGELAVLLQPWTFESEAHGAAIWTITDNLRIVFSADVIETVIWASHSATTVKVLMPAYSN